MKLNVFVENKSQMIYYSKYLNAQNVIYHYLKDFIKNHKLHDVLNFIILLNQRIVNNKNMLIIKE